MNTQTHVLPPPATPYATDAPMTTHTRTQRSANIMFTSNNQYINTLERSRHVTCTRRHTYLGCLLFFSGETGSPTACFDDFASEWHLAHSGSRPCLLFLLTSHHVVASPQLLQEGGIAARAAEEEEEEEEEGEAEGTACNTAAAAKEPAAAKEEEEGKGKEGGLRMGGWGARRARAEKTDTTMRSREEREKRKRKRKVHDGMRERRRDRWREREGERGREREKTKKKKSPRRDVGAETR